MSDTVSSPPRLDLRAIRPGWLAIALLAATVLALVMAQAPRLAGASVALTILAGALLGLALAVWVHPMLRRRRERMEFRRLAALIETDFSPALVTDTEGAILMANPQARTAFDAAPGRVLASLFDSRIAAPGPLFRRMREAAGGSGHTVQEIASAAGDVRISVRRVAPYRLLLWRIEDSPNVQAASMPAELPGFVLRKSGAVEDPTPGLLRLTGSPPETLEVLIADPPLRPGELHHIRTSDGLQPMHAIPMPGGNGGQAFALVRPAPGAAASGSFDALPVPILTLSPEGRVKTANRVAAEFLGRTPLEGVMLGDLVEGLGRPVEDWIADIAAGRGPAKPEVVRAAKRDEDTYLQISVRPMTDGKDPALLAVLGDATELKTLEMQFVQSQKMHAIGQLAGGVAHDFNNLLTAISGHCDLLLLRHDSSDADYADLMQIAQNANRAASLVGQLLAFSRKQTLQLETVDLRETLGDMTHLLNRLVSERIRLVLSHDPDLRPIRGDRRQLEQVLMNLVVNARDAMPEGGEISIETATLRLAQALKRDRATVPAGEYTLVKVRDQGIGIPPDKMPKIFEPFFTTKRQGEGTGLGLSTAYGIVKQSGGFIFADSAPGSGTEFSLYFPTHDPVPTPVPAHTDTSRAPERAPAGAPPNGGVVLLVEDEAPVRAFAARALRMRGYTVLEAGSAEEALETLADASLDVDLFVTDVVMPGLDGPSWVGRALEARPKTPVIFVSGYSEESVTKERMGIANSVFLPKPFSLADLTRTVEAQLS